MGTEANNANRPKGFDPDTYRPDPSPDVTLFDRGEAEAPYRYVIIHEKTDESAVLSAEDKQLWDLCDGTRTTSEVCGDYLAKHKALVVTRAYELIERLGAINALTEKPNFASLEAREQAKTRQRFSLVNLLWIQVPGTSLLVRALAPLTQMMKLESNVAWVSGAIVALFGIFVAASWQVGSSFGFLKVSQTYDTELFGTIPTSYLWGILLLLILQVLTSFGRAIWKAAVIGGYTKRYRNVRFVLNYGLPAFAADEGWRRVLPLRARIACSASGIALDLIIAAGYAMALTTGVEGFWAEVSHKLMLLLYLRAFMHLSPFAFSDIQRILTDWSNRQGFVRQSFAFLRTHLVPTLLGDRQLDGQERLFLGYNVLCVGWLGAAVLAGLRVFEESQQLIRDLYYLHTVPDYIFARLSAASPSLKTLDLSILAEEKTLLTVIIVVFALSIVMSLLVALAWAGYVFWSWLSTQPWGQKSGTVICTAGLCGCVWVAVAYLMDLLGVLQRPTVVCWIYLSCVPVCIVGALGIRRYVMRYLTGSTLAVRYNLLCAALLVAGVNALLLGTIPLEAGFPIAISIIGLVSAIGFGLSCSFSHHGLAGHPRLPQRTAELANVVGVCVLMLSYILEGLALRKTGQPSLAAGSTAFVSSLFLVISSLEFVLTLSRDAGTLPPLRVQSDGTSHQDTARHCYDYIIKHMELFIGNRLGDHILGVMEKRVSAKLTDGQFSWKQGWSGSVSGAAADKERAATLTGIHDFLRKHTGPVFSCEALEHTLDRMHLDARTSLHQHLFPDTIWQTRFTEDLKLDVPKRRQLIDSLNLFGGMDDAEKDLLSRLFVLQTYDKDAAIVRQGDIGRTCFIIVEGELQVEEEDAGGDTKVIAFLGKGDFFGEAGLLGPMPRAATVRATSAVRLLALHGDDFEATGTDHPKVVQDIRRRLRTFHVLLGIPLFGDLPKSLLRSVIPRVGSAVFKRREKIIQKDDIGDSFYLIESGTVQVLAEKDGIEVEICELGGGDYFGEIALLRDIPRTATVRAVSETRVLVLQKEDFLQLTQGSKLFALNVEVRTGQRLEDI